MTDLKSNPNEALLKYLDRYCTADVAPNYAVLLRGPWGSGKTWFIRSFRKRLTEVHQKRSLYVTLYGVSKTSEITDQFFAQIHPRLADARVQKSWTLLKGFVKGTIKIDIDGDGKEDGNLQLSLPELGKWASTEGAVLIFDDLERASMKMEDLLGYINQFVEHEGYRVMVIANEERVVKVEPGFFSIKEKVLGRTFEIQPDVEAALHHFFEEINSDPAHTLLVARREIVLQTFARSGYGNLRQLRQAILDFTDLWNCIASAGLELRSDFLDRLTTDVVALSIEYRAGTIQIPDIQGLGETNWLRYFESTKEESATPLSDAESAFQKHGYHHQQIFALVPTVYGEFFGAGHLLPPIARQALLESPYLATDNTASWRRLWYLTNLTDAEFEYLSNDVYTKFIRCEYTVEGELLHAAAMLLDEASDGLLMITVTQMLQEAKRVVRRVTTLAEFDPGHREGSAGESRRYMSAFGLGYTGRGSLAFKKFAAYYRQEKEKARIKRTAARAEEWMRSLGVDTSAWTKRLEYGDSGVGWFADEAVLSEKFARSFCNAVKILPTADLERIRVAFQARYENMSSYTEWKLNELPFLKKSVALLTGYLGRIKKGDLKLSAFALKTWFIPGLKEAIHGLEAFQSATSPSVTQISTSSQPP